MALDRLNTSSGPDVTVRGFYDTDEPYSHRFHRRMLVSALKSAQGRFSSIF